MNSEQFIDYIHSSQQRTLLSIFPDSSVSTSELELINLDQVIISAHTFFAGSFLIPYTICVIFGAVPMFMLEVAMGQ